MSLPARIRVNATFPFPALTQGSGPVTISKAGGIWTVGFSVTQFGQQLPPPTSWSTDFLIVWDNVNSTFFKMSIADLASLFAIGGRVQRFVTTSPIVVAPSDSIINCRIAGAATCALPASATRVGAPVTFKDTGQASAHPIVITANGAETIDGAANYIINNNMQSVTLVPFNDGTNTGWAIE